jgi:superkiller protein 3
MDRTINYPRGMARLAIAALVGAGLSAGASPASAQDVSERYRVLVANFAPQSGAKENFGKDVAKELRKHLGDMATHQAYEGKDFKDSLKKYGLKEEDLAEFPCIKARQLATQENVQLVLCGAYDAAGKVQAEIISPAAQETFEVPALTSTDPKQAAEQISTAFTNYTKVLSQTVYCSDYIQSQQYQQALENCEKALEVDPKSKSGLRGKAAALYYLEKKEEALATFKQVLEQDGLDQESLKFAGIIAVELGQMEEGRKYFDEYLELNPEDAQVRQTIAQDMAKAGDFEGALGVLEKGFTGDSVSIDMQAYAGSLALQAAEKKRGGAEDEPVSAEARALYEKALGYFDKVLTDKGDKADVAIGRNMLVAHQKLGNTQEATALGERLIGLFPNDATLLQVYALNLKEQGKIDDALAALDKAAAADPKAQVNKQKMAWLIEAGRVDAAAAAARAVVEKGEMPADQVVTFIAGTGWNQKGKKEQHAEAIQYYELASSLAPTAQARAMPNFFWGYALFKQAIKQQEPGTLQSARASLPNFQKAKQLLEAASGYQEQDATRRQLLGQVDEFINIQELLIKRGR